MFHSRLRVPGWGNDELTILLNGSIEMAEPINVHFTYRPTLIDAGDDFVLDAAVNGGAEIVTFNIGHFALASRFDVHVYRPGELLMLLEGGLGNGKK